MSADGFANPNGLFGKGAVRIDGPAKVRGAARYPSDEPVRNAAWAVLVTSTIARGRIKRFDLAEARALPGVLDILTHETVGGEIKAPQGPDGQPTQTTTLEDDRVWHDGQIIGIVLAESYEIARDAARRVKVEYESQQPSATFGSSGLVAQPHKDAANDPKKGDVEAAFAIAPVTIDAAYTTPIQHHNPLELFTTTAIWDGPKLLIYEPSQSMWGLKAGIARTLQMDPENVRVISRFVGGAFGAKGAPTARTAWIAIAARRLGRPVKLVATRAQGFTIATYRAETRHHLKLAADRSGRLMALRHEGWEVSSRPSGYNVGGVDTTAKMYACPNIATAVQVVHADRNTPGFMRAPAETPYMFALESAMDELAHALKMDPVELRRVNDTRTDPVSGHEFSSRSLMKCFDEAAARFGWGRRNPEPGSMRDGDWLIGYGCAAACYPSNVGPAVCRLTLAPDGRASIELAAHEIGTGAYTTIALAVAQGLGLPLEAVTVTLGDSSLPPVPVAGGSNNAASTTNVALKACGEVRAKVAAAAAAAPDSPLHGAAPETLRFEDRALVGPEGRREGLAAALARMGGPVSVLTENAPKPLGPDAVQALYKGQTKMARGSAREDVTAYAFGAHFVEVRVHRLTREIRTPRLVSAFAAGTIINPVTARSQYLGGAIWGLGSALHEATEIDTRAARYLNKNLADYLVPVNADVPEVDIIMVPEQDDRVNPLGVKGIGEIGIVGMNAAVANAVFHATGKRVRALPIRAEDLL